MKLDHIKNMDKSNGSRISDLRDLLEISCSQNQSQNKIDKVGMDLDGHCFDTLGYYLGKGTLDNGILCIKNDQNQVQDIQYCLNFKCLKCGTKYGLQPNYCHGCGHKNFTQIEPEYQSLMR